MNNDYSYIEDIKNFKEILSSEADILLQQNDLTVVYVGRETCPYCRKFARKLSDISYLINTTIYYINTASLNDTEISSFRQKYNIVTIPGFIVNKNGYIIVRCDSSIPEQELLNLINN